MTRKDPEPSSRNTAPHTTVSVFRVEEVEVTLSPFTNLNNLLEALHLDKIGWYVILNAVQCKLTSSPHSYPTLSADLPCYHDLTYVFQR